MDGAVSGLNHLTLAVTDVARSIAFYTDLLGCKLRAHWHDCAYLEAGPLWLCLSRDEAAAARPHPDYTHIAFSVAAGQFAFVSERVRAACVIWRQNRSEGESIYFLDPDGHRLELHVGTLESRLAAYRERAGSGVTVL